MPVARRVVITGQGAISALGVGVEANLKAMRNGECGISALEFRDVERLMVRIGGQIKPYDETRFFDRQQLVFYDKFTQLALISAAEAMQESGLEITEQLAPRSGVILGTSGGGLQTQDENFRKVYEEGKNRVHPFVVPRLMNNAAVGHVSMRYHITGPSYTVSTACASSNHAMGQAFQLIRAGGLDVALTGGSESMLSFGGIKAWEGLRVMSRDGCRPFCATRNGMVQGEGAAVFVFEEYQHARARGAPILAEVVGFAMTADAGDIVTPDQQGAASAMQGAMNDAGLNPADIGYINAHGTGTKVNDRTEIAAIKQVFGDHARKLRLSSTKSMHGHLIGGTGAVELLACIMALREGVVAPTIGHKQADPECDLNIVPNVAQQLDTQYVLSNSFAFGGLNAVLALAKAP